MNQSTAMTIAFILVFLIMIMVMRKKLERVTPKKQNYLDSVNTGMKQLYMNIPNKNMKCNSVGVYNFKGKSPGPHVLIVAGTHGNEPAGTIACFNMLRKLDEGKWRVNSGEITIIPAVNLCGLLNYERLNPHADHNNGDINRTYPKEYGYPADTKINGQIIEYLDRADWVIDCHEAHGYYQLNNTPFQLNYSMGSTVTHGKTDESKIMTKKAINEVNKLIDDNDRVRKFVTFPDSELPGSFRYYVNKANKHYMLIETTGQNEIQRMSVRVLQQLTVIKTVLLELKMISIDKN